MQLERRMQRYRGNSRLRTQPEQQAQRHDRNKQMQRRSRNSEKHGLYGIDPCDFFGGRHIYIVYEAMVCHYE